MRYVAGLLAFSAASISSFAEEQVVTEEVHVIGTALTRGDLDVNSIPFAVQTFSAADLSASSYFSAVDLLEDRAASVTSNAAQNNRLQPDIQYRGFTASPLLGLSQGLAVYQNGVRVNEVFGDTVNWDLLPASSFTSMQLIGGSNPIYGLNTIGGALAFQTKTGFSDPGGEASATVGQFGTEDYSFSQGGSAGQWGYMAVVNGMSEDGWRDYSESSADSLYGALSWRGDRTDVDVFLNYGDTDLRGNGTVPVDLLRERRESVFTHPDTTQNELTMISASLRHSFTENFEFNSTVFYRDLQTHTFNGDGAEYEECGEDDDADETDALTEGGEHTYEGFLCNDDGEPVTDTAGLMVEEEFNGINNRSDRDQQSYGLTLQGLWQFNWLGLEHETIFGADIYRGETEFASSVEFAELTETRGTTESGRFDSDGFTTLHAEVDTWSVFASDLIPVSESLSVTLSTRFNHTRVNGWDPTGARPELEGRHSYSNLNAGLGVLYEMSEQSQIYANIQTSTRTPTPVELACSHPDAPCTLPNSFLADPPLDDVQSVSIEAGLRGQWQETSFRTGVFLITADDDILFQTTGGVSSNQGFFQNAADTQRAGLEVELSGEVKERLSWYLNYTYLEATFESAFFSSSPNNPASVDDKLFVRKGSDIPGLPDHNLKLGAMYSVTDWVSVGFDARYADGQYLRGDEANVDEKTDGFWVADVYMALEFADHFFVEARVDNVFDEEYETFGLYGEADEVLTNIEDESGRFLGPAAPRMAWVTIGARW